jgi:hypothetical protein
MSMDAHHWYPSRILCRAYPMARCWLLPLRNPKWDAVKPGSNISSNTHAVFRLTIRSITTEIPSLRILEVVPSFGMSALRPGLKRQLPALGFSWMRSSSSFCRRSNSSTGPGPWPSRSPGRKDPARAGLAVPLGQAGRPSVYLSCCGVLPELLPRPAQSRLRDCSFPSKSSGFCPLGPYRDYQASSALTHQYSCRLSGTTLCTLPPSAGLYLLPTAI